MTVLFVAWQLAATAVGAALGSFLALSALRLSADRSILSPPSHCPVCRAPVRWSDNVPLLGWFLLRGRCRDCGTPIPPLYPLVEAGFAALGWLVFRRFVPGPDALDVPHLLAWGGYLGFAWLLVLAAYTDVRSRIIPTLASVGAVSIGVAVCGLLELVGYEGWLAIGWKGAVLGAAIGWLPLWILSWAWEALAGREGLGGGDVRMIGMIGAFLGAVPGMIVVLLLASFGGAFAGIAYRLWTGRSGYLAFGPWLTAGALAYLLYGDVIVGGALPSFTGFLPT